MAECCGARCAQDRRHLKKELLTWMKKIPLFVGLQEIATQILDKSISNELFKPLHYLESDTDDWSPESRCHFCGGSNACVADVSFCPLTEQDNITSTLAPSATVINTNHSMLKVPTPSSDVVSPTNEPLDLSATRNKNVDVAASTPVQLIVPLIHNKSGCAANRRRYTPDELSAAVVDICSGRLGTRKAATLYGIPRSTLRNKIFRMNTAADSAGSKESPPSREELSWQRRLEQLRRKHDLGAGTKRPFGKPPLPENKKRAFTESAKLTEIVHRLTNAQPRKDVQYDVKQLDACHQGAWEIDRRMEQLARWEAERPLEQPVVTPPSRELRIPQFRSIGGQPQSAFVSPMSNAHTSVDGSSGSSGSGGDTLKELIAKTITEKLRTRCVAPSAVVRRPSAQLMATVPKKRKSTVAPANRPMDGKRTRPKRGQYRRYNNALLQEAVRCVQRGEMSVHRAGSHYGVPHSTLEYKVKERHLLRKARTNQPQLNGYATEFPRTPASDMLKELQRKATEGSGGGGGGTTEGRTSPLAVK